MKKKLLISILILILITIYSCPPIMFAKGAPIMGRKEITYEKDPLQKIYYATDFDKFYVLNLRIWDSLEIERLYSQEDNTKSTIKKELPFLYSIEHVSDQVDTYTFQIKRNSSNWYFDYLAIPNSPAFL